MIARLTRRLLVAAMALGGGAGCSDHDAPATGRDGGQAGAPADEPWRTEPVGECNAVEAHFTGATGVHLPECSDIEYPMSPPVFGDHYPAWAAYQTYEYAVPLGYLVHALEHGAVVLFYDCPDGCAAEVAKAQAFVDALPADPRCADDVRQQVILVPRPGLGSPWAAAAWGYSLVADCFDTPRFGEFYEARVGHGPEDLCNQGLVIPEGACDGAP